MMLPTNAATHVAPQITPSPLLRVNIMLSTEVLAWLDDATSNIRRQTGSDMNRSMLLRAIVGAFAARRIQFTGLATEAEVRAGLLRWFGTIPAGR